MNKFLLLGLSFLLYANNSSAGTARLICFGKNKNGYDTSNIGMCLQSWITCECVREDKLPAESSARDRQGGLIAIQHRLISTGTHSYCSKAGGEIQGWTFNGRMASRIDSFSGMPNPTTYFMAASYKTQHSFEIFELKKGSNQILNRYGPYQRVTPTSFTDGKLIYQQNNCGVMQGK